MRKKGQRLAERLGTKWYNKGEKSAKNYLCLLNRGIPKEFRSIQKDSGELIMEEKMIKEEIVNFYKNLYEDFDYYIIIDNDVSFLTTLQFWMM